MIQDERRFELEEELARRLSRALAELRRELVDLLGDPPDPDRLQDPDYWKRFKDAISEALFGPMLSGFLDGGDDVGGELNWEVDPAVLMAAGIAWVSRRSEQVASDMRDNTQGALAGALNQLNTVQDIWDITKYLYGPGRAARVAITEMTFSIEYGKREGRLHYYNAGGSFTIIWVTEQDDRVCEMCRPLHGKKQGDGWTNPPPLHPGCRCQTETRVERRPEEEYIVDRIDWRDAPDGSGD